MLHFRNEKFMNCLKMKKEPLNNPFPRYHFSIFLYTITQNLCIITEPHIQTRKLRAVSVFISYPPFSNSLFRQIIMPFTKNPHYPTPFYLSATYYHGNPGLLRESILLPDSRILLQSPSYQRHQKRKKERSTNHSGEPLYA